MAKFCKKCGSRVDETTGVCPNCGNTGAKPPNKKKKNTGLKIALILLVVLLIVGAAIGALAWFKVVNIPILSDLVNSINPDDPINEEIQPSGTLYTPDDNSVVLDEDTGIAYINNIVIIFFNEGTSRSEIEDVIDSVDGVVVGSLPVIDQYQVKVKKSTLDELIDMCEELKKYDCVADAMFDEAFSISEDSIPNDPWNSASWSERKPDGDNWWAEAIEAVSAWDYNNKLEHIRVGIVDSGFDNSHSELKEVIKYTSPINNKSKHGTHVAGLVAAEANNGKGIAGLVWNCDLVTWDWQLSTIQKLFGKDWSTTNQILGGTVQLVEMGAKVVNLSAGQTGGMTGTTRSNNDINSEGTRASRYLYSLLSRGYDFLIVQSAGNGNESQMSVDATYNGLYSSINSNNCVTGNGVTSQDIIDRIIIVGAAKNDGNNSYTQPYWSNAGSRVDICAPGYDVYSTVPGGKYKNMSGTSMAAPIVTGVAAMTWAANSSLSGAAVKKIVCENTKYDVLDNTSDNHPLVNDYRLVNAKLSVEAALKADAELEVVLVLDASGSMSGNPMDETKNASNKFIETVLDQDAAVGVVSYDNDAKMVSGFTDSEQALKDAISSVYASGGTDIEAGLSTAWKMLKDVGAKKKIIVLMSDGMPNDGKTGDNLISYADEIKNDGVTIYTLGFFESVGSDKASAQALMEALASEGYHYEVASADDLVFFFGDVADQISGQRYIYIRIACPVDVRVSHKGEVLNSREDRLNTRTEFGTLTFEESEEPAEEGVDNRVKVLRLKEGVDYDIEISGNGKGTMDYTIGFMDENGDYSDMRRFRNIKINKHTEITTVANADEDTVLKVDEDGDGKIDLTYKAGPNGRGELVDYSWIFYVVGGLVGVIVLLILAVIIRKKVKQLKNRPKMPKAPKMPKLTATKPTTASEPAKTRFCKGCGAQLGENDRVCGKCGTLVNK